MVLARYSARGGDATKRRLLDRMALDSLMPAPATTGAGPTPPLDVIETDDAIIVGASLAGASPEAIDIIVHRGVLTVAGESNADGGMPACGRRRAVAGDAEQQSDGSDGRYHGGRGGYAHLSGSV